MNKIYRVVWNTELGQWVVASEVAKGRKKKSTRHAGLAVAVAAVVSVAAPVHAAGIANDICGAPANAGSGTWSNVVGCGADGGERGSLHNLGESVFGSFSVVSRDVSFASTFGFGGQMQAYYGSGFGTSTFVGAGATNSVALGTGSVATEANTVSLGRTGSNPMAGTWVGKVGVGDVTGQDAGGLDANLSGALTRRLTNMSAGIAGTDAVNVNQLKGVTMALGGGTAVNADGSIKAPTYTVQGSTANDVGTALGKLDAAVNNISIGGTKYFHAKSTAADSVVNGAGSIAIGGGARADGEESIAIGSSAFVPGSGTSDVAIGKNAKVEMYTTNAVSIGADSYTNRNNTVSVGNSGAERQVVNVAKGTADFDAVNVSQLKGVTAALGGGSTVDASGNVTKPNYTVDGKAVTGVDGAIAALDAKAINPLAVAYDTATKDKITLAGTGGTTITNVKDGAVAAGSKDAVNGGHPRRLHQRYRCRQRWHDRHLGHRQHRHHRRLGHRCGRRQRRCDQHHRRRHHDHQR